MDPGASTKKEPVTPKDRRVPLAVVEFTSPVSVPGCPIRMLNVTPGEGRTMQGATFTCPAAFFDPETRSIWIEGRCYPLERVHYWEQAKMAKKVAEARLPNYTIGKKVAG